MSVSLTGPARTILRSRVRRHPDIARHVGADADVSKLSAADLIQLATLLGLNRPTAPEIKKLETLKEQGMTGHAALRAMDEAAVLANLGGSGLAAVVGSAASAPTGMDDDADDMDDEADEAEAHNAAPDTDTDTDAADAAKIAKDADAAFGRIQGLLASGDFKGYGDAIKALAVKALTPPPAPVVQVVQQAYIDPSKIKGQVPTTTGRKSLSQAGVTSVPLSSRQTKISLPVYDAADAPTIDAGYVWPADTGAIFSAIARGRNVMLTGPAGTGKTEFAVQLAARFGRPFVRVSCDDQTEAATLVGMTVPAAGGGTTWQDGQLAAAVRKPGTVILIDEPSVARPGALFVLQALMDTARSINVAETGEVIRCAPDVTILLADNTNGTGDATGAYEATRRLNRATLDRLSITVPVEYLDPVTEAKILVSRVPGLDRQHAAAICKFMALTRRGADDGKLSHGLGLRRGIALAEQIADGTDPNRAFHLSVLMTMPHDDREPLRQMWTAEINGATFK